MKVSIAGAGFYGSTLAQRIAEAGYAEEVVLTDSVEGKPQGLALDLMQSRPLAGFEPERGTDSFGISPDGSRVVLSEAEFREDIFIATGVPGIKGVK